MKYWLKVGLLSLAYWGLGYAGLSVGAVSRFATVLWAPSGLALVVLLLGGVRLWPGVALGAFLVNLSAGAHPALALAVSVGNTLEGVTGALVFGWLGVGTAFERVRESIALCLVATGATLLSATIGVASLAVAGQLPVGAFGVTWRTWWLGDVAGILLVSPLLLGWYHHRSFKLTAPGIIEAACLGTALLAVIAFVFLQTGDKAGLAQPHLFVPVLLWAAVRFGIRGTTLAVLGISAFSVVLTAHGLGPFVKVSLPLSFLSLQVFHAVLAATLLLLTTALAERQAAVRARDELLAMVSHDLRSPLATVTLTATMALNRLPGEGDPALVRDLGRIQRSANRMERMVVDLLDTATFDANRLVLAPVKVDAHGLLDEAVELLKPHALQKGQRLQVAQDGSFLVQCDRDRILQVLANLVGNAIKFTPIGGQVTVSADAGDRFATFRVSDTGPGIARESLDHVFDRFWKDPAHGQQGSGLGLWISKALVEAHDGRLWVESVLGSGSTFCFTLPTAAPSFRLRGAFVASDAGHAAPA